jgi:hypothetical protein
VEQEIQILGIEETLRAFNRLPKEANKSLRERSKALAQVIAGKAQSAGRGSSAQSALVAQTVKARSDRIPKLAAGGAKRVGRNRTPAHKIFFGAEFGAGSRLPQFRPHLGREGYWLYPTVRANTEETAKAWQDVLDDVAKEWTKDQPGGVV